MRLIRLQKINNVMQKYSSLILSSLLLLTKKDNLTNVLFYSILSFLGYFMMNKSKNNIKNKDWKEFINNELNLSNDNSDNDSTIENKLNKNVNELKNLMKNENLSINEDIDYDDYDDDDEEDDIVLDESNLDKKIINKKLYPDNAVEKSDNVDNLLKEYTRNKKDYLFKMKVNESNKNMPIFNLRSSDKIDFYWNFHLHNADNTKINNLILCRDIHQWMNNSSISNEDLENQCYPFYIITRDRKTNNKIMIFEAYKIFVYSDEDGNKQAFVMKGDNYKTVEEILSILIKLNYIKDLLNGKEYEGYTLSVHDSVMLFLNNLLSHFLPYESSDGELINIDLKQFNENKTTFDYFYHNNLVDNEMFNTNI
jgi:hypothetical protein